MGGGSKNPDTSAADAAAAKAEERAVKAEADAKQAESEANRKTAASTRASLGRRTGRRLLIAPGREDQIGKLNQ